MLIDIWCTQFLSFSFFLDCRLKRCTVLLLTLLTITQCYKNDKRIYDTTDNDYNDGNLDSLTNLENKRKESNNVEKPIMMEIEKNHQTNERITKTINISPILTKENITSLSSKKRKNRPKLKSNVEKRELEDAVEYGLKAMEELINVKEPQWYKMGKYIILCILLYYIEN